MRGKIKNRAYAYWVRSQESRVRSLADPTCEEGGDAKLREGDGANAGKAALCETGPADFCITEKKEGRSGSQGKGQGWGQGSHATRKTVCASPRWNESRVHFAALMHPTGVNQRGGGWQAMYHRNVREGEELRTLIQAQERA